MPHSGLMNVHESFAFTLNGTFLDGANSLTRRTASEQISAMPDLAITLPSPLEIPRIAGAVFDTCESAESVEFRLEDPVGVLEGGVEARQRHGRDAGQEAHCNSILVGRARATIPGL